MRKEVWRRISEEVKKGIKSLRRKAQCENPLSEDEEEEEEERCMVAKVTMEEAWRKKHKKEREAMREEDGRWAKVVEMSWSGGGRGAGQQYVLRVDYAWRLRPNDIVV